MYFNGERFRTGLYSRLGLLSRPCRLEPTDQQRLQRLNPHEMTVALFHFSRNVVTVFHCFTSIRERLLTMA